MSEKPASFCKHCDGEITPGVLFCWRHAVSPPKVGEFAADSGQLLWRSSELCVPSIERGLAVLLEGDQVAVAEVSEILSPPPARVNLEVSRDPRTPTGARVDVHITLMDLLEAIVAGREEIEARRTT